MRLGLLTAQALEQLNEEEFWSHARRLASQAPSATGTPQEYLRCELRSGNYLIPLAALHEVVSTTYDARKPHAYALLPAAPAWMVGLVAWRGETIAVIDLDAYLLTTISEPEDDPPSTPPSTLLIASREGNDRAPARWSYNPPVALLVPNITPTTLPSEAPILDLCDILEDVVQQIKDAAAP